MGDLVVVLSAAIGAIGAMGGPIGVVLIQKSRKEQHRFRIENDLQHGNSMRALQEIKLSTRETAVQVKELRYDFEDHLEHDHL